MAITDELRSFIKDPLLGYASQEQHVEQLTAIADRIDSALAERYVELPKDADGEYIHIGDKVTCGASVWEVTGFRFTGGFWGICCTIFNDQGGSGTNVYPPSDLHHYHEPTVEDVLREFYVYAERGAEHHREDVDDAVLAEYAAKLQLRGDAE